MGLYGINFLIRKVLMSTINGTFDKTKTFNYSNGGSLPNI